MQDQAQEFHSLSETYEDPVGTIVVPYQGEVAGEALASWLQADWRWLGGRRVNRYFIRGSMLTGQRNLGAHSLDGDWLLFIDADMEFGPTAIGDLVSSYHRLKEQIEEPIIVGGLCTRRYPPYSPTVYRALDMTEGPFRVTEDWGDEDYVEVDATGGAFLLIETAVFSAIVGQPFASFEERRRIPRPFPFFEYYGTMGEDLVFCLKAKAHGCRIFVDTRIRIGHVARHPVGIEDYWRAIANRSPEDEARVREVNDSLGMPTLSAERARELLR